MAAMRVPESDADAHAGRPIHGRTGSTMYCRCATPLRIRQAAPASPGQSTVTVSTDVRRSPSPVVT